MRKRVSLKDIAQIVGVSTALVSYVLNNQKEGRIRKEVALKIKEVARQLNYRTNQIAKTLQTSRTYTIGLIVADISNPFSSALARIIEDEAEKYNYTVLFGSSDESEKKTDKLINVLLNRQVDGFIIAASENAAPQIHYLQENDIPFVLVDRYFPDLKTSYVAIDNYKAAYTAVQHLVSNGCNRIGLITFDTALYHLQERKRGYEAALKENNLPVTNKWIKEVNMHCTPKEVEQVIDELLALPPPVDALLFATNILSVYGLKYINILPVKVPDDLAIVSFDESNAADLFYAPLTHVKQPLQAMGQTATKILLESINKNDKTTQVNLEAEFIVRKSSLRPATGKTDSSGQ
jgi:LacI family transcriptional regulator